jgi:hypothetical protein
MQWTHPEMQGDLPPPCRARSATLVSRKIILIGGGENVLYYNSVHVFDIPTRRWSRLTFTTTDIPAQYHTANLVQNVMIVIGGIDGHECFQDIWCLNFDPGAATQCPVAAGL